MTFDEKTGHLYISSNSKATLKDILSIQPDKIKVLRITKTLYGHIDFTLYKNLDTVDISHVGGFDIVDLSNSKSLKRVKLSSCPIKEMILPDSVMYLNVSNSDISSFDISENIIELNLPDNNITNIDLSKCINLRTLNLSNNELTSIDISNNPLLYSLIISCNRIHGLLNLSNNPNITTLYFNDNFIDYIWLHQDIMIIRNLSFSSNLMKYKERGFVDYVKKRFDNELGLKMILDSI